MRQDTFNKIITRVSHMIYFKNVSLRIISQKRKKLCFDTFEQVYRCLCLYMCSLENSEI